MLEPGGFITFIQIQETLFDTSRSQVFSIERIIMTSKLWLIPLSAVLLLYGSTNLKDDVQDEGRRNFDFFIFKFFILSTA